MPTDNFPPRLKNDGLTSLMLQQPVGFPNPKAYVNPVADPESAASARAGVGGVAAFCTFGDSNTARGISILSAPSNTYSHYGYTWPTWVGPASLQRCQWVANFAESSQRIIWNQAAQNNLENQINSFFSTGAAAISTHCAVMIGTNDVSSKPSDAAAELRRQLLRLRKYKVVLSTIYPADATNNYATGGTYDGNTVRWQWILVFNELVKQIALELRSFVTLVDSFAIAVDSTSSTSLAKSGMLEDGLHSNTLFAQRVGTAYANAMCQGLPSQYDWITSNACVQSLVNAAAPDRPGNILSNPCMVAGTTVATGFTVTTNGSATNTSSLVANPNGYGNCQQLAVDMGASGDFVRMSSGSLISEISAGDTLFAEAFVRIPASSGICTPRLQMGFTIDGLNYFRTAFELPSNAAQKGQLDACDLLIRTPDIVIPNFSTFTLANTTLTFFADRDGTAGNVLVGQYRVQKKKAIAT